MNIITKDIIEDMMIEDMIIEDTMTEDMVIEGTMTEDMMTEDMMTEDMVKEIQDSILENQEEMLIELNIIGITIVVKH